MDGQPARALISYETRPCLGCGACCVHAAVDLYPGEDDGVPRWLRDSSVPFRHRVRTRPYAGPGAPPDSNARACLAFIGELGSTARCALHWSPRRPVTCRFFPPGCGVCNETRKIAGLPPLAMRLRWFPLHFLEAVVTLHRNVDPRFLARILTYRLGCAVRHAAVEFERDNYQRGSGALG